MPRRPRQVPSYCLHKATGQAYVTIDGREQYLGPYGSPQSKEKYARVLAERMAEPDLPPSNAASADCRITIDELVLKYWTGRVVGYYLRDGKPSERQCHIRLALRPLCDLYGCWIELDRKGHSAKPEEVRRLVELVSPPPYLELYGRSEPPSRSWTVYGNQILSPKKKHHSPQDDV